MYYYVNDTNRLVRTSDAPITIPGWRLVTLEDWNAFRLETKRMKRK